MGGGGGGGGGEAPPPPKTEIKNRGGGGGVWRSHIPPDKLMIKILDQHLHQSTSNRHLGMAIRDCKEPFTSPPHVNKLSLKGSAREKVNSCASIEP